jgi:hypothetical protein
LHLERGTERADGGVEDGEDRVSGHVDHAAGVRGDAVTEDVARGVERAHRGLVVERHQAGVARDVRHQDRDEALPDGTVGFGQVGGAPRTVWGPGNLLHRRSRDVQHDPRRRFLDVDLTRP